ncbi:hypothetical protein ACHAXR_010133 [Thalassiosira sp. AJA248-18]
MAMTAEEDVNSISDDDENHPLDDDIHITDSGAMIQVAADSSDDAALNGNDKSYAGDPAHLRCQLAELASELLRLQEQTHDAEPRRTDLFAPERLRRWIEVTATSEPPSTPGGVDASLSSPATPSRNAPATPLDSLPTPTSTSEGRTEAASLLRSRIQKMQLNDESGDATENRIADFTGEVDELRVKKGEAEAEAALLSAELVALRGKHEEEKRQMMKTAKDLRRRNEELESRITMQRLGSSRAGEGEVTNSRSVSCPRVTKGEEDREGDNKFGFRMRALAQRWASPHPTRGSQSSPAPPPSQEDEREANPRPSEEDFRDSFASTIHTDEGDFGQVEFGHETQPTMPCNEESTKLITALEEQLRQSENRCTILEQRLNIVKESGDAVIQSLNEELADLAEDRARSEAAMIKELSILDSQRRAERNEYEKRIQEWIAHDANRKVEVEEYETRIESLLGTVQMMTSDVADCPVGTTSSSWDREAEEDMYKDLIEYIELLQGNANNGGKGRNKRGSLVMSINDAFDLEFNANPNTADGMIEYYRSRPELKEFTLKSELPRMDYEVLVIDGAGKDKKLVTTDEIRSYFASLDEASADDEEVETIIRAANQSLLADPLALLTGEGDGKLVHSGSFYSTVIATVCSFKLDLRCEGERRVKVQCELAICVPSGNASEPSNNASGSSEEKEDKLSATLELARANLVIQFSPSPTSTPSGPLVKYHLMDIKPTITDFEEGSGNTRAIQSAAAVLARDRHSYIQNKAETTEDARSNAKTGFISRMKSFSTSRSRTATE